MVFHLNEIPIAFWGTKKEKGCLKLIWIIILFFRYQFFLQLKYDLLYGRLDCPFETVVELAAFALQCKYL